VDRCDAQALCAQAAGMRVATHTKGSEEARPYGVS
jgi:hypothetical protein